MRLQHTVRTRRSLVIRRIIVSIDLKWKCEPLSQRVIPKARGAVVKWGDGLQVHQTHNQRVDFQIGEVCRNQGLVFLATATHYSLPITPGCSVLGSLCLSCRANGP